MKLIEEARQAWRFASVRLAVVAGVISGWAATDPQGFARLMEQLPSEIRPLVGLVVMSAAIFSRLVKQEGKANG